MLNEALIHDPKLGFWLEFRNPIEVLVAHRPQELMHLLASIEHGNATGLYAAGYVAYEAAAGLDAAFSCSCRTNLPAAVFGLFEQVSRRKLVKPDANESRAYWSLNEDWESYRQKIERIRRTIGAGGVYQANYSIRLKGRHVDAGQLFEVAAAGAPYGAYLDLDDRTIVSASPELFFRLEGDAISSSPMKGTAPRGLTIESDRAQGEWLQQSEKNRAENLMITDMVRNDLGRIAVPGSVQTEAVFATHRLPTLWQMTSTVHARTEASLGQIFRALFPAASITGAPKIASSRLIKELEESPRGAYTGAIGYVAPKRRAQFNVAIRTATVNKHTGNAVYGVGGGIVWDSKPLDEYDEIQTKTRAVTEGADLNDVAILETLRWTPGTGFYLFDRHLTRARLSAEYFGIPFLRERVEEALSAAVSDQHGAGMLRVRLILSRQGEIRVTSLPLECRSEVQAVALAASPVDARNRFLYHKTTVRSMYEQAADSVAENTEALLWNKEGYVTESVIANLEFVVDGESFTPPVEHGLLQGVLRAEMLARGQIEERPLPVDMLPEVEALFLISALRGRRAARLVQSQSVQS